jgi:hypothetical protein
LTPAPVKSLRPYLENRLGVVNGRLAWEKKSRPHGKTTKAKKFGFVVQVVKGLPSKCETLSSNPSNHQKRKEI